MMNETQSGPLYQLRERAALLPELAEEHALKGNWN